MITEHDLLEAIAECQGQRNPTSTTCIKLAAYYTILNNMEPNRTARPVEQHGYSFSGGIDDTTVEYDSGTAFSQAVNGMDLQDVLQVMDELMASVKVLSPRLYDAVMTKLQ